MIVKYRAFSWTMTASELKEVLIANVKENLNRSIRYTEKKIEGDPDREEALRVIRELVANLEAGEESPHEWTEVIAWTFNVQDLDITLGGSVGKCTYYAATGDIEIPRWRSEPQAL